MKSMMKPVSVFKRQGPRSYLGGNSTTPTHRDKYVLKLCVLYHDDQTRQWAQEVHTQARKLVGRQSLKATWWNIQVLNEPAVLAGAVTTAMHSDVIVLAIRAEAELPLAFYYWADAWLPHRYQEPGALLALLGVAEQTDAKPDRIRSYLRTLAHRGGLDFMHDERRLPAGASVPFRSDARLMETVAGTFLRTLAYRDGRYECWRRMTKAAA
jgi:hypothetical protein